MQETLNGRKSPNKSSIAQKKKILAKLIEQPASRRMVGEMTEVYSGSVCWSVSDLINSNYCFVLKKAHCEISGRLVEYLSCDPNLKPQNNQLSIEFE